MFIAHTKIQKDNKIAKEKLRDHLIVKGGYKM